MRLSLNWLKEYVDIEPDLDTLCRQLTMLGLEIEAVERPGDEIQQVYVGQILSMEPHPDADKLSVCTTDVGGDGPLTIVCGAKNMKPGDKVPTAVIGATLPGGFAIGKRKMRGIPSQGMMCSAKELGLGEDHDGLLILNPDLPIGADAKESLGLDDVVLEIEVTPNRGDWASMIGTARELAALYGAELRIPALKIEESGTPAAALATVEIADQELCPRYLGRVLTEVKVGPSPEWLCKKLIAAGMRPINNAVDITNYVLMETGHPLHAFDYDKLAGHKIVARRATPGEKMHTLDGEDRRLSGDMLVIADADHPQAVAGVMGGAESEVGEGTQTVFLESAYFNPASIRATSRALGLISESSQRFQRGADPEMAVYAINRAAMLMAEVADAKIAPGLIDAHPAPLPARTVTLRFARAAEFLGADIDPAFQVQTLERMGFSKRNDTADGAEFAIPSWRHDVSMEADLMEEIGRHYGYDKIPVTLPAVRGTDVVHAPREGRLRKLRDFLVGLGLTERFNWTFTTEEELRGAGLESAIEHMVRLENPLSEKQSGMRCSLLPAMLANMAKNIRHGSTDLATFEMGPVYTLVDGEELPAQGDRLCIALCGNRSGRHWSQQPEKVDFFDIKGLAEALAGHFGREAIFMTSKSDTYQQGQCASISFGGKPIGRMGKVGGRVSKHFGLSQDAFLLEIDLETLVKRAPQDNQFVPVPGYPASMRDLAVLVPEKVPSGDLAATVVKSGGKLLKEVQIFDIYTGDQVPAGKKSVALNLVFQSPERTLTDKDTQKTYDKILKHLEKIHEAALR